MSIPIVPAIIPSSLQAAIEATKEFRFSHEIHVDVVDGKFVEAISWPYDPVGEVIALKPHTDAYTLEVDLMVEKPFKAARVWEEAGADMLVFHMETVDFASFKDFIEHSGITVGISFHGETSIEAVLPYIEIADYVQIMGINKIGGQGQPFNEETFSKIERIKKEFPEKMISVDGSVNEKTITRLAKVGVDRLIVGSAIVKQSDPQAAYQALVSLVNEV
jgi:ribulose-phosphate 3-epimerase